MELTPIGALSPSLQVAPLGLARLIFEIMRYCGSHMKQFFIALVALALVHSAVSICAFRFLAKTTVESSTDLPPVETTTPDQRARGESSVTLTHAEVVKRAIPTPVIFYLWFGYAGLAAAALYALYFRLRHG